MTSQFDYFIKNFNLFYNTEKVKVNYGPGKNNAVSIVKSVEDNFWKERNDADIEKVIWKEWKKARIPFLFDKDDTKEILTFHSAEVVVNYDIVASAFYFLSGWNELVDTQKDKHGRVVYENSMIRKLNVGNIPVVNYYFDILSTAVSIVYKRPVRSMWGEYDFCACLTHDIDNCNSAWLEGSFSVLKKKKPFLIPKLIIKRLSGKDDWFNFAEICRIEKQFNATSSFYFLPQKRKTGNISNADYNIKSKKIQKVMSFLQEEGKEVGVHGSIGTHSHAKKLKTDIHRIDGIQVIGNRFHFLMYDIFKSVSVLEECGIKYDSSLGFAERIGFRRGTCYPFFLYNFEKNRMSSVIEIPLIVMDSTLAHKKYMGMKPAESSKKVFDIIDEIKKFNGVFTLLWHNTHFSDFKYTGWREVYISILEYCRLNNGLLTNGQNIYSEIVK